MNISITTRSEPSPSSLSPSPTCWWAPPSSTTWRGTTMRRLTRWDWHILDYLEVPDVAHNWLWTHFDIRDWNTFETALSRSTKSPTTTTRFHKIFSGTKHLIPCLLMKFHLKVIEVLMEERKPHKSGPQVKQKISEIEIKNEKQWNIKRYLFNISSVVEICWQPLLCLCLPGFDRWGYVILKKNYIW